MNIGVFDSGIGGMSIVRALRKAYPEASLIYYGDTLRVPYGEKSPMELIQLADRITGFLLDEGADLIIDACNTTSALALDFLRQKYGNRAQILGVLEPAARRAGKLSQGGVGVMATQATVASGVYPQRILGVKADLEVHSVACPLLVPFVEAAQTKGERLNDVLAAYVNPLKDKAVDTLVLGCTHYPFLEEAVAAIVGEGVQIIDPAQILMEELAPYMADLKETEKETKKGPTEEVCYVSKDALSFEKASRLLFSRHGFQSFVELDVIGGQGHEKR